VAVRLSSICRSAAPLLGAVGLHVAVTIALLAVPVRRVSARHEPSDPPREATVEAALEVLTEARAPEPIAAPPAANVAPTIGAASRLPSAEGHTAPSGVTTSEATIDPSPETDRGSASAGWFRPNAAVDLQLHAPAGAPEILPDRRAPMTPPPVSTTGGLAEALDAEDFARGLGRGGPVLAAVEEAAHGSDAPTFGTATFSVVIGADGKVNVDVAAAGGDRAGWEGLRPAIRTALLGKPVRIAPKTRGLRVTVQVEASEQFPGGGRPPPPSKMGTTVAGSIGKITETKEHIDIEPPSVALTYRSRNCAAGIVVSPGGISLGAGCNPGVAMRVVAARIVREERL
jgi:hypothetical protein